jgi:hypothetical protein
LKTIFGSWFAAGNKDQLGTQFQPGPLFFSKSLTVKACLC